MNYLIELAVRLYTCVAVPDRHDERGDVPGWVMITVMTVAIVGAIWAVADDQLTEMLRSALGSVGKG